MDKNNKKWIGIILVVLVFLLVLMFADLIFPTLTSTPIRFDVTQPITVNDGTP